MSEELEGLADRLEGAAHEFMIAGIRDHEHSFSPARLAQLFTMLKEAAAIVRRVEDAPTADLMMSGHLLLSDIDHACLGLVGQRVALVRVGAD